MLIRLRNLRRSGLHKVHRFHRCLNTRAALAIRHMSGKPVFGHTIDSQHTHFSGSPQSSRIGKKAHLTVPMDLYPEFKSNDLLLCALPLALHCEVR